MPLQIPDNFYYYQRDSRERTSHTPQGDIAFDHLLQNKPDYWINPSLSQVKKKKKLIFANLRSLSVTTKIWNEIILELRKAGFELYVWDQEKTQPIGGSNEDDDVYGDEWVLQTKPSFSDDIIKTTYSQNGFTQDEIQIVDAFWLKYLIEGKKDRYTIKTQNIKNEIDKQDKNNSIIMSGHLVTNINNVVFKKEYNNQVKLLKEAFPEAIVQEYYREVNLDALESVYFVKAMAKNINYSQETIVFTPRHLFHLDNLTLNVDALEEPKSLTDVFEKTTELTDLTLYNATVAGLGGLLPQIRYLDFHNTIIKDLTLLPGEWKNLQSLKLSQCTLSYNNLKKIITASPKLKILDLSNCILTGAYDGLDLRNLEELTLGSHNQVDIIKQLSNIAPNLKKLFLPSDHNTTFTILLPLLDKQPHYKLKLYPEFSAVSTKPKDNISPSLQSHLSKNSESSLDANTQNDANEILPVQKIFYTDQEDPHPRNYRLQAYNAISIQDKPCSMDKAFLQQKIGDLQLTPCAINHSSEDVYAKTLRYKNDAHRAYYGKQKLVLTNEWQAVASLSAQEQLVTYHLDTKIEVEFQYSQRDNLYYVRSKTDVVAEVTLDFMVVVPNSKGVLPADIERLANHYEKDFTEGGLVMNAATPTGHDYLKAIQDQCKGACRHRAFAFKAEMKTKYPDIPVRLITNDCHDYVEVFCDGHWIARDLGGYAAQLAISEGDAPAKPKNLVLSQPISEPGVPLLPNNLEPPPDLSFATRYLETWNKETQADESVAQLCQKVLQPPAGNKRLIELNGRTDVNAMRAVLEHQSLHSGKRLFYINSPDDLVCAAPWIAKKQRGKDILGVLTAGPGGRLYEFLHNNPHNEPRTLLINYANFSPEDIVRLNTLLDKEPQLDGVAIPPSVSIVGMTDTQGPHYYSGEDFYSRFDEVMTAPKSNALMEAQKPHSIATRTRKPEDVNVAPLYLFHSANWKNDLLGHWIMEGKTIRFKEGLLQKALDKKLPLLIHQGLWEDEDFVTFWEQAKLYGRIEHSGGTIEIPATLELLREDNYNWDYLAKNIKGSHVLDPSAELLNPGSFAHFFSHYACDNTTKTLSRTPGFIEAAAKKTLSVYLTRALTQDQWGMLGHACAEHGVTLQVHPAPGVEVPAVLPIKTTPALLPTAAWDNKDVAKESTTIITSNDVDATAALLIAKDPGWLVLDITGCKGYDLLSQINASFDAKALSFSFSQTQRALLTALEQKQKVLLKGTFSPELLDELAPLIQKRAQGGLVLVGDDFSAGHYLKNINTHKVSPPERLSCLEREFSKDELTALPQPLFEKESLAQLKARLIHQRSHPGKNSDEAWIGLKTLPERPPLEPLREQDDTAALAKAVHQQRKEQVMTAFKHSPYVYLTGLTASGKTTFVERHLKTDPKISFHSGTGALKAWALDKTPGKLKLFFEDEINLGAHPWHELEGLFNNPPGILIEGVYYPLTPEHRMLMAGNPVTYGDERQLSPVFEKHGNALLFEPLPLVCIYEDILKPVFADTDLSKDTWALCQPFLEVYAFLLTHSQNELLISPRELQMMAALTLSHCQRFPQDNKVDVASYYAYQVTQHLVPEAQRAAYLALPVVIKAQQNDCSHPEAAPKPNEALDFLVTPSRLPIARQLTDLLRLSELRKNKVSHYNHAQLYGGLGGIILTGDAGIGKSELVIAVLRQLGYQERHFKPRLASAVPDKTRTDVPQKLFYRMPASLSLSVKKQLILQAFDEGAVLIADEINSNPLLERWFNDLLMGKHPLTGQPPKVPGFCLIGTQNPVTLAGRRKASPATNRRLLQVHVPSYSHEEMVQILIEKHLSAIKAEHLVTLYDTKQAYAKEHRLKPPPTFRDLLKLVKLELKRDYQQALNALDETIRALPHGYIKEQAQAIKEQIGVLNSKGEANLTPFLSVTNQFLRSPANHKEFQNLIITARQHTSPAWNKLSQVMFGLAIVITIATLFALAFTGFGIIPAIGIGVSVVSSGMGFFAKNRVQGLANAMSELDAGMQHKGLNLNFRVN